MRPGILSIHYRGPWPRPPPSLANHGPRRARPNLFSSTVVYLLNTAIQQIFSATGRAASWTEGLAGLKDVRVCSHVHSPEHRAEGLFARVKGRERKKRPGSSASCQVPGQFSGKTGKVRLLLRTY